MRVIISDTAKAEIAKQTAYIRDRNPVAARRVRTVLTNSIRRLREHPRMGKPGRLDDTRELVIPGTPFVLIYEIMDNYLTIVHVLHGRQQWPREADDSEE